MPDLAGGTQVLASVCARHRRVVAVLWLVGLVAIVLASREAGARFSSNVGVAGSDSARATDLAARAVPGGIIPDAESVVLHARRGTLDAPLMRERIKALGSELGKLPRVAGVIDPFSPAGAAVLGIAPVSANRRTAITSVIMKGSALQPNRAADRRVISAARAYNGPDLQVEVAGPGAIALNDTTLSPVPLLAALAAALLLLSVTLRSRIAVAVCAIVVAATTVTALAATFLLSHTVTTTAFAALLAGIIATGASLGGAIVVVHRTQSCLRRAVDPVEAATEATAKPGLAVACGGLSLAVVMVGVAKLGLSSFAEVAMGGAAAGAAAALVVLTLLPAMLAAGGPRLLGWTERQHLTTTGSGLPHRPGIRARWARLVGRRPQAVAVAAGLVLLALAIPAVTLDLGGSDDGVDPTSMSTRRAYDVISTDFFPGLNGPILVVIDRGDAATAVAVPTVVSAIAHTPGVVNASVSFQNAQLGLTVIRVSPRAGPRSPDAVNLVRLLRERIVPDAVGGTSSRVYIGGATALFLDIASNFRGATTVFLLLVLLVVGALGFLVLGSMTVAAALAAASALSALAAAGVIALLFQTKQFATALGLATGPVEPSFLVLVLVTVFGLSPGLNLSLLARLIERRDQNPEPDKRRRRSTDTGMIRRGHADVGHVVLTMNLVMVFIFVAIAAQSSRTMKVLGCGMAAGVSLDAFLLRAAFLPALLHLRRPRRPAAPTPMPTPTGRGRHSHKVGARQPQSPQPQPQPAHVPAHRPVWQPDRPLWQPDRQTTTQDQLPVRHGRA